MEGQGYLFTQCSFKMCVKIHDTLALIDRTLGIYIASQPCFIHSYVHSPAPRCNMIHLYQSYLYCKEGCGVGVACPWNAYYARSRRRACLMPASSPPCRTQPVKPLQGQNDQNLAALGFLLQGLVAGGSPASQRTSKVEVGEPDCSPAH